MQSEPNSVPESSIDLKDLLSSYNDLSSSFRTYLTSNISEYTSSLLTDLRHENLQLHKEKSYLIQTLSKVLSKGFSIIPDPQRRQAANVDLHDLVSQACYHNSHFYNEKIISMQNQLDRSKEVLARQDLIIKVLKDQARLNEGKFVEISVSDEVREKSKVKAELDEMRQFCLDLRKKVRKLEEKTFEDLKVIKGQKELIKGLVVEKTGLERVKSCLEFEVSSLKEVIEEYEKLNLAQVTKACSSEVCSFFKEYSAQVLELRRMNWRLEAENKELAQRNRELQGRLEGEARKEKLAEELESTCQSLVESRRKNEDFVRGMKKLQEELEELRKNYKKLENELDGVKSVASRRIEFLENSVKMKENKGCSVAAAESLNKLVVLLHKVNQSTTIN